MTFRLFFLSLLAFFPVDCMAQTDQTPSPIHYTTFGTGLPVLIINGGPGMNSQGFAFIAQEIARLGYQTIIYDQRGTGQSKLPRLDSSTITMDLMAADIEQLREQLGISQWTVMGHSFGGLLATHYAAKYPKRIQKLIFSSSGGVNLKFREYITPRLQANLTKEELDSLQYYQHLLAKGDTSSTTRQRRAAFLARAYVFDKKYAPAIAERLLQVNFRINSLVFEDLERIHFNYKPEQFVDFSAPILVIQGKNDLISVETATEIGTTFPHAQVVLLDQCGHYGWLDQYDTYMNTIQQFLSKP